ncbi:TetR family transcriptional regulator [Lacrimispora xylanisolvens]|jgi:AcrR family transcriptional regulator|uniref:TetR family transcriptional regulator n=1 Tax=Lacrimispora xylanisolvens TaxID=384636 RepID=A0A2S6HV85_9FIRM|nr:TetR/AcrR family transcriptional regulator [Hungatella xylanolytica]MBE5986942.1 TetR/AcrR family transcriptional regulator [Paenibacillaceae bacterium]PPK81807.1 TetR family transcriptional regulator [Hungatella xylanolytica]
MAGKGRPRSESTEKAILNSAHTLVADHGFQAVTIEGIAKHAGVSKATIYKWWPNKAAVVADSFFKTLKEQYPVPDTGSVIEDLVIQISNLSTFLASDEGRIIRELIAEGQSDSDVAEAYQSRYFSPRREVSRTILERGVERGEMKSGLNLELCVEMIYAPLFYRLLITGEGIDEAFLRNVVSCVLKGLGAL